MVPRQGFCQQLKEGGTLNVVLVTDRGAGAVGTPSGGGIWFLAQLKAEVVKWFEIHPSTWCARFVTIRPSPYPMGSW
jgi:hypothetical protein